MLKPPSDLDLVTFEPFGTQVVALSGGGDRTDERMVAVESAVNVVCGGVPFAVMMMTPKDLEDFASGFGLTEGIIGKADELRAVSLRENELGMVLNLDLAPYRLQAHLARRRALSGRTGCGICGIEDLAAVRRADTAPRDASDGPLIRPAAVRRALREVEDRQTLNKITGAVHAAGFARLDGGIEIVREDVGRHNALDKLIGAALRSGIDPRSGFVVITSRCSFEMVEKTAAFGANALIAISVPTSLALQRARHLGIALAGIARRDTMTAFCGIRRFEREEVIV